MLPVSSASYIESLVPLVPHVFLPRRLPTEQSPDLQRHESALLRLFADFLRSPDLIDVEALEPIRQAFATWADLQAAERIDPQKLAKAIRELRVGQHLPLLIRAQNAGLLISFPTLAASTHPTGNSVSFFYSTCPVGYMAFL